MASLPAACTDAQTRERSAPTPATPDIPASAANRTSTSSGDIIGQQAPPWHVVEWANSEPRRLQDLRGHIVFVRFWTDTCPYCERTMAAIQKLAEELRDQPVVFVGIYHSKPSGSERPWGSAVALARTWGVTFPIAYDRDWRTLGSWWLHGKRRSATSASFVIDAEGRFVHVHPGPVFHPSDKPSEAAQNRDHDAVRTAILRALQTREEADPQ